VADVVDVRVEKRVVNAVVVTYLCGQVEDYVFVLHVVTDSRLVPDVGDVDIDPVSDRGDVEHPVAGGISAGVEQRDPGAQIHQPDSKVAPDHPESTGDEDALAVYAVRQILHPVSFQSRPGG